MLDTAILIVLLVIACLLMGVMLTLLRQIAAIESYQETIEESTRSWLEASKELKRSIPKLPPGVDLYPPAYKPPPQPKTEPPPSNHRIVFVEPQAPSQVHTQRGYESGQLPAFPPLNGSMQRQQALPQNPAPTRCDSCGTPMQDDLFFCVRCGKTHSTALFRPQQRIPSFPHAGTHMRPSPSSSFRVGAAQAQERTKNQPRPQGPIGQFSQPQPQTPHNTAPPNHQLTPSETPGTVATPAPAPPTLASPPPTADSAPQRAPAATTPPPEQKPAAPIPLTPANIGSAPLTPAHVEGQPLMTAELEGLASIFAPEPRDRTIKTSPSSDIQQDPPSSDMQQDPPPTPVVIPDSTPPPSAPVIAPTPAPSTETPVTEAVAPVKAQAQTPKATEAPSATTAPPEASAAEAPQHQVPQHQGHPSTEAQPQPSVQASALTEARAATDSRSSLPALQQAASAMTPENPPKTPAHEPTEPRQVEATRTSVSAIAQLFPPDLDQLFRSTSSYPKAVQVFRPGTGTNPTVPDPEKATKPPTEPKENPDQPTTDTAPEDSAPAEDQGQEPLETVQEPSPDAPAHSLSAAFVEESLAHARSVLAEESNTEAGLQFLLGATLNQVEAANGAILLLDAVEENPRESTLRLEATFGDAFDALLHKELPANQGMLGYCVEEQAGLLIDDAAQEPSFQEGPLFEAGLSAGSFLCAPIQDDDLLLGIIVLRNPPSDEPFTLGELHILTYLAHLAGDYLSDKPLSPTTSTQTTTPPTNPPTSEKDTPDA